jgi:hypothetical protein
MAKSKAKIPSIASTKACTQKHGFNSPMNVFTTRLSKSRRKPKIEKVWSLLLNLGVDVGAENNLQNIQIISLDLIGLSEMIGKAFHSERAHIMRPISLAYFYEEYRLVEIRYNSNMYPNNIYSLQMISETGAVLYVEMCPLGKTIDIKVESKCMRCELEHAELDTLVWQAGAGMDLPESSAWVQEGADLVNLLGAWFRTNETELLDWNRYKW